MMRIGTLARVMALAGITLVAAGCNQQVDPTDTDQSGLENPAIAEAVESPKDVVQKKDFKQAWAGHHGMSPTKQFYRVALHDLELSDIQREALKNAESELKGAKGAGCSGEAKGNRDAGLHALLGGAAKTGTLDQAAVDKEIESAVSKMKTRIQKEQAALNTLHDTLNAEQRSALVTLIKQKQSERPAFGKGMPNFAPPASDDHAAPLPSPERAPKFAAKGFRPGMHPMTFGLDLTEQQQASLDKQLAAAGVEKPSFEQFKKFHTEHKATMDKLLTSFVSDNFEAADIIDAEAVGQKLREGLERHAKFVGVLLPILTEEQRTLLAQRPAPHPGKWGKRRHAKSQDL